MLRGLLSRDYSKANAKLVRRGVADSPKTIIGVILRRHSFRMII